MFGVSWVVLPCSQYIYIYIVWPWSSNLLHCSLIFPVFHSKTFSLPFLVSFIWSPKHGDRCALGNKQHTITSEYIHFGVEARTVYYDFRSGCSCCINSRSSHLKYIENGSNKVRRSGGGGGGDGIRTTLNVVAYLYILCFHFAHFCFLNNFFLFLLHFRLHFDLCFHSPSYSVILSLSTYFLTVSNSPISWNYFIIFFLSTAKMTQIFKKWTRKKWKISISAVKKASHRRRRERRGAKGAVLRTASLLWELNLIRLRV